ncbi:MAG: efflux RND transporter periplasmic adaptor subunit [Planctomycetota bacterium]
MLPAGLLLLFASLLAQGQEEPMPPATVSVALVTRARYDTQVEVLGDVRSLRESEVSAEIAGLAVKIDVIEGARVREGDLLLSLDSSLKQIDRQRAAAEYAVAEQALLELETGSREEDVRQGAAELDSALANLREAETDRARVEELRETDVTSEKELTAAVAKEDAARALVAARRAVLDRLRTGPRSETVAQARARLQSRAAELALIDEQIRRMEIRAPFDGVVTERHVEPGEYVSVGDPIVLLVQMHPIEVRLQVPEQNVAGIEPGRSLELELDALPGVPISGEIAAVVPKGDRLARTFPVRVVLENPDHRLLPGMAARARIPAGAGEGLAVPLDAVVRTGDRATVYRIKDLRAQAVPVKVISVNEEQAIVQGDLAAGDQVAVRGNEPLFPGREVEIIPANTGGAAERQP